MYTCASGLSEIDCTGHSCYTSYNFLTLRALVGSLSTSCCQVPCSQPLFCASMPKGARLCRLRPPGIFALHESVYGQLLSRNAGCVWMMTWNAVACARWVEPQRGGTGDIATIWPHLVTTVCRSGRQSPGETQLSACSHRIIGTTKRNCMTTL